MNWLSFTKYCLFCWCYDCNEMNDWTLITVFNKLFWRGKKFQNIMKLTKNGSYSLHLVLLLQSRHLYNLKSSKFHWRHHFGLLQLYYLQRQVSIKNCWWLLHNYIFVKMRTNFYNFVRFVSQKQKVIKKNSKKTSSQNLVLVDVSK